MAPEEKPRDDGLDSRQLPTGSARDSRHGSKPIAGRLSEIPPSVRKYPIPFFAISGLVAGFVLSYGFGYHNTAGLLWLAVLVLGGAPIVARTAYGLAKGKFNADVVAMLAILAAIITGESFAGIVIVLMQSGGEALEDYATSRASSSLNELIARAPRKALRKTASGVVEIRVEEVNVGDILLVRQGDIVAVDGVVVSGEGELDEAALTGEPVPALKSPGSTLVSGSIALSGAFEMRATKISKESEYERIVQMVREAQKRKPQIQRIADRYAVYFTPITLAMSALGFLLTHNVDTILAVLVVATPCPLIIATPIAIISGINRAAKESIVVKSGASIEQVGTAKVVAFDKTGTLTIGQPVIDSIKPANAYEEEHLLYLAGCAEQMSSHAVAKSIVAAASSRFGKLEVPSRFMESPGRGITAEVEGKTVSIGAYSYVEGTFSSPPTGEEKQRLVSAGHGSLSSYIAIDGNIAGIIFFKDRLRPGVDRMVGRLKDLGVLHIVMLTGDNSENANIIAAAAGIKDVQSNLLPSQKVDFIKELGRRHGTTLMVGDGINDAPALASATIGIAMGAHGSGISSESADMVILVDDVTLVTEAIVISRRMMRVAKQSITVGLGLSVALMVIAAFGYIQPAIGAIMQEVIDASVILNALRAR